MKNDSLLPDNQFLHVRLEDSGGICLKLIEYDSGLRKQVVAIRYLNRQDLQPSGKIAARLDVMIEFLGEAVEHYKRQRREFSRQKAG